MLIHDAGRRVVYCLGCERPAAWHGASTMRDRRWVRCADGWRCPDCAPPVAVEPLSIAAVAAELGLHVEPYHGDAASVWCRDGAGRLSRELRKHAAALRLDLRVIQTGGIITVQERFT